jgi:TPR repeat protein
MRLQGKIKTQHFLLSVALGLLLCIPAWAQSSDEASAKTTDFNPALMAKAKAGNADAEFYLGFHYQEGKRVPQSYTEAAVWYRKAAEQGNANAQSALGVLYRKGQGVPQDDAQATIWWRKAAAQGEMFAQANLGSAYERGSGVPQDYTQAAVWYRKAAEQGEPEAQSDLGLLYQEGKGVPQDYTEAYFWLDLAVAQETQEEQGTDSKLRDDAAKKLTPGELMKVQERARKWFEGHPTKPQ